MKYFSIVIFALGLSTLVACNGGGGHRITGRQCPADYKGVTMNLGPGQSQLSMNPSDQQLIPGIYTYQGSTFYVIDRESNFRAEVTDAKNAKSQQLVSSITCSRNATGVPDLNYKVIGLNYLEVGAGPTFKTTYDTREISLVVSQNLKPVPGSKATNQKVEAAPGKAYEGLQQQVMMVKLNNVDFEVRSHYADALSEHILVVRLKRADLPAPKAHVPSQDDPLP